METIGSSEVMNSLLSLCLGLGLAAACGFRVFVPMLGLSIASLSGHLELAYGFEWLGTWPAFGCLLVATILEVLGFYVPWIDNALDTLATPAAVIAGTIVTASVVADMSPLLRWSLAVIAGGGVAGTIQVGTVAARGTSSVTTLGVANFAIATGELGLSTIFTLLAFLLPILAMVAVLGLLLICVRLFLFSKARPAPIVIPNQHAQ